jgi:L-ascorbate metabolism protein UlaG (beta-lactamase superfamily)
MSVEIQWLGHASFRIAGAEAVAYIDPWKLKTSPHDADIVVISHSHHDHFSPDDIKKVSKADTAIVAPGDVVARLGAANAVTPGDSVTVKDVTVEAVAAYNVGKTFHPRSNQWIGVVLTIDAKRVYYAGDTDFIPEMEELQEVDVALLPVGGTYTLSAAEAARACKAIGCKSAVPYHWGDIVGSESDARQFVAAVECEGKLLLPGQAMVI